MREIKFRAFDVQTRELLAWDHAIWQSFQCKFSDMQQSGYLLEQFTGLKDNNGREIFEGDILAYEDDSEVLGIVCFVDGCFMCGNELGGDLEGLSIIGNIHENPELLEMKS